MGVRATFSLDELLAELEQPEQRLEGYRTSHEWAAELGIPHSRILKLLGLAYQQGKLMAAKEPRIAMDGSRRLSPVYCFKVPD